MKRATSIQLKSRLMPEFVLGVRGVARCLWRGNHTRQTINLITNFDLIEKPNSTSIRFFNLIAVRSDKTLLATIRY